MPENTVVFLKNVEKKGQELVNKILPNTSIYTLLFGIIMTVFIVVIVLWAMSKITLNDRNCRRLGNLYSDKPALTSVNPSMSDGYHSHNLRDYYVKSAYNCCAGGNYKSDYVNLCALSKCLEQGARFLDFEIYSVDGKAVISVSSENNYNIKQTYNYVLFNDAMEMVASQAFSSAVCPNNQDPLIIHLRIMSNLKETYNNVATSIHNTLGRSNLLLPPKYSNESYGKNLGEIPIKFLKRKAIIMLLQKNTIYEDTSLIELVNINSTFISTYRIDEIKYDANPDVIKDRSKKYMTVSIPNLTITPNNYNPIIPFKLGCQFICMSFQNPDNNLKYYHKFFEENNTAFVLKDKKLRHKVIRLDRPTPPEQRLSLGPAVINTYPESKWLI